MNNTITSFEERLNWVQEEQDKLITRKNIKLKSTNGIFNRYFYPVITRDHVPVNWRYDFNPETNPYAMERIIINATMNSGALLWNGRYLMVVRVEAADRKSFFVIAESDNGVDNFIFWDRPLDLPDIDPSETNVYDMRLTAHEDGWVYGVFCSERLDPDAGRGDFSSAIANSAIVRTKDLIHWERLPNIQSKSQQRNVVLHPEFVNGKYAFYTRPQDHFITVNSGFGIGWALVDDITQPIIKQEVIINRRDYHTIKELKNGEGPAPIKTAMGWLHLAHGVRGTAAGLRYVLYTYLTSLDDPTLLIAEPAGYLLAPEEDERIGDVSNVVFSNGWIVEPDGRILIYYASSDTRMHVAETTVEKLLDYCINTRPDGLRSFDTVNRINELIDSNSKYKKG